MSSCCVITGIGTITGRVAVSEADCGGVADSFGDGDDIFENFVVKFFMWIKLFWNVDSFVIV